MLTPCSGLPIDLEPQFAREPSLIGHDLFDDQAQQMFAIRHRSCGCMPHPREIFADGQNRVPIVGGDLRTMLLSPGRIFLFRRLDRAQLLFPELFEMPRDQPILRFDRVILPLGALRFETHSLQAQLPLRIQCLGF
jgi:hypothetical protein